MKKAFKTIGACICSAVLAVSFAACGKSGKRTELGKPKTATAFNYSERNDEGYLDIRKKAESFAAEFAPSSYALAEKGSNFTVSPVSVYMALALAAECANGGTRAEILSALGVSYEGLKANISKLYRSLESESERDGKIVGILNLSNSVWVNEGTEVKQSSIDALASDYYAYSYAADFVRNNKAANAAVREFVKEKTRGLIDQDFKLSDQTLFALINTLYLKTIWNDKGSDLPFTQEKYDFVEGDGTVRNKALLRGYYNTGRAYEGETYTSFYTKTYSGYRLKFLVPKDGHSVNEVFTTENLSEIGAVTDYRAVDEEEKKIYNTRCLFPEYECAFDGDVKGVLREQFGIDKLFKSPEFYDDACDFSSLTDEPCYCEKVRHVTKLKVNKKGIEGAAVTILGMPGAAAPDEEYEKVYLDFVVDKAFGFVITDPYGVTLFSGVVNKI